MIAILSPHYKRSDQRRAIELLSNPTFFPGLAPLGRAAELVQVYTIPSFTPITSWTLYRLTDDSLLVRRVRWDFQADHAVQTGEPTVYGADALVRCDGISAVLSELDGLEITPFSRPQSICILDGVGYGVRRSIAFGYHTEMCWQCDPTPGCEPIANWFHRFVAEIEALLPADTDQLRLTATRS